MNEELTEEAVVCIGDFIDIDECRPSLQPSTLNKTAQIKDGGTIQEKPKKSYLERHADEHNYAYLHNPANICMTAGNTKEKVFVIFVVVTAPKNSWRRRVVRETYGSPSAWPLHARGSYKRIFLLGSTSNATIQRFINKEAEKYGDIVQESFVDVYENLTLKTTMALKWVTNFCRHAQLMMKIDDDSMISQTRLLSILDKSSPTNWTAGKVMVQSPVFRNPDAKFFLSEDFYPLPTYPPYLNGPGYILSTDLVEASYQTALTTPIFPWEDVFVGFCLAKLNVKMDNTTYHRFLWIPSFDSVDERRKYLMVVRRMRSYVVVTNLDYRFMRIMWAVGKLKSPGTK
ncbi:beta-1,3-galactosyltransferase 5-like [Diadema antillarum]|uniref:beta-1,3-galactosyltransferase 5-like n=1 Tax=Diadema antillarum TaxID=105358 RepID=UPI003A89CC64